MDCLLRYPPNILLCLKFRHGQNLFTAKWNVFSIIIVLVEIGMHLINCRTSLEYLGHLTPPSKGKWQCAKNWCPSPNRLLWPNQPLIYGLLCSSFAATAKMTGPFGVYMYFLLHADLQLTEDISSPWYVTTSYSNIESNGYTNYPGSFWGGRENANGREDNPVGVSSLSNGEGSNMAGLVGVHSKEGRGIFAAVAVGEKKGTMDEIMEARLRSWMYFGDQ